MAAFAALAKTMRHAELNTSRIAVSRRPDDVLSRAHLADLNGRRFIESKFLLAPTHVGTYKGRASGTSGR